MFLSLEDWVLSRSELDHLARGRAIFRDFLREQDVRAAGIVPSTTGEVGAEWIKSERAAGRDLAEYQFLMTRARLAFADFGHRDLSRMDLSYADLTHSVLDNADLTGSRLVSSNLTGAFLRAAVASDADFSRSVLDGSALSFIHCEQCDFKSSRGTALSFNNARLPATLFDRSELEHVSFQSASLIGASFVFARLHFADFANADLYDANFSGADLRGSDLRFARNINNVSSWCGATLPPAAMMPRGFSGRTSC